jgi:hypothetical protein
MDFDRHCGLCMMRFAAVLECDIKHNHDCLLVCHHMLGAVMLVWQTVRCGSLALVLWSQHWHVGTSLCLQHT